MSLITRCPACGTMFRVVPDQLRISEGWVRCGHCAEVFDASSHLQPLAAAMALPVEVSAPPASSPVDAPVEAAWVAPASFSPAELVASPAISPPLQVQEEDQPQEQEQASESQAPEVLEPAPFVPDEGIEPHGFVTEDAAPEPEVISAPMHRPTLPDNVLAQEVPDAPVAPEAPDAQEENPPPPEEPTESTIEDMSFVREARRKAFWRRGSVRAVAGIVCALLLIVLALQVVVQERDRLAVLDPRAKPWLDDLCAPLGCKVAPLRQIESLVIESSSFNKVRGNAYRLSVSIRNRAALPLAMPGIELALTDSQDQPVLRRVLLPADLGAAAVLAPGAEWSGALPVSVASTGEAARIAGYRLLAFYP